MVNLSVPRHVGLIMDGNGRWAKKRLMPRSFGHKSGMNRMIGLARHAQERGVEYLTVYALSTENLQSRPKDEIDGLFGLFRKYFAENVKKLYENNAGVKIIGDLSPLPEDLRQILLDGEENSPQSASFFVVFAINYGSRAEVLQAVNRAISAGQPITEQQFDELLYTAGIPAPDLIIRTGGEIRLSNFLTYQAAYSELYFTDVLFPDFSDEKFDEALEAYAKRERRFGKI